MRQYVHYSEQSPRSLVMRKRVPFSKTVRHECLWVLTSIRVLEIRDFKIFASNSRFIQKKDGKRRGNEERKKGTNEERKKARMKEINEMKKQR